MADTTRSASIAPQRLPVRSVPVFCGERPVTEGYMSMMCPKCRTRIEEQNRTRPYPLLPPPDDII
ncbi:hypothetical protein ACFROC_20445 [Nocardia tengchongensis]|uniref:hypothetical protein n=1 Tax=Nocardia tengchongensis TaxID=2055889 RepID=UPI0036817D49